jgi:hypothetical protein
MKTLLLSSLRDVDDLLRGDRTRPQSLGDRGLEVSARRLAVVITALSMIYGLCMGTFSLLKETPPALANDNGRYWQVLASVVKTPALFVLTLIVTLPSLYVFNALVGSRLRVLSLIRLLVASLAVNAAVLASLGPIVAFFSVSTSSHAFIVLLNVAAFGVAGVLGLMFLLQTMHRLTLSDGPTLRTDSGVLPVAPEQVEATAGELSEPPATAADHLEPNALDMPDGQVLGAHTRTVFQVWIVLFGLVGAQMGWVLRPFIGSPDAPFTWFRERHSNFFAAVLGALRTLLLGDPN